MYRLQDVPEGVPLGNVSFDTETNKATKCFLCDGKPKCVEACPAEALNYVAWRDLTDKIPPAGGPDGHVAPAKAAACQRVPQEVEEEIYHGETRRMGG